MSNRDIGFGVNSKRRPNAHVAGWRPGSLSEGRPCPVHCLRGIRRPGPRISGSPVPTMLSRPPWALGLRRPTSPVPGVPTQRYSPFVATLPTRQQGSCTPPKWVRAYIPTNSKTTSIFVNLTHPLTHIILTPGSLGRESLLPPITHRTMHSTITPYTQARWPHSLNMSPPRNSSTHTSLFTAILLTTSPNYLVLPRHPLIYSTFPFNYVAKLRPHYTLKVGHCHQTVKSKKTFSQPKADYNPSN